MAEIGNWKDILKAQNDDLARLETMDAELNSKRESGAGVALRPSSGASTLLARRKSSPRSASVSPPASPVVGVQGNRQFNTVEGHHVARRDEFACFGDIYGGDGDSDHGDDNHYHDDEAVSASAAEQDNKSQVRSPGQQGLERAPETQDRYLKAKVKLQTQQLQVASELKLRMEEETRDLQRQLKQERENSKGQKNRIQQLEIEMKRQLNSKSKAPNSARGESVDDLRSEIAGLKRDVETAQRIAKNAEAASKTKDVQLKRASESLARMKTQLEELTNEKRHGSFSDQERLEVAEARVRTLEKQRTELMDGFRKQMKLIDVLKRQKVHMEAARLLAFTEEEFMKTLDWKI